MDLRIPWNCKMDSILKEKYSRIRTIRSSNFPFPILHFFISFGGDGRRRERGRFKNFLEFKMDSILKEKYSRIRTIQSSNFLFSILHFFISFGGGRRKRGGFKNSLELQDGFDSKKNLEYVQFNRLISPFLFFISSFLLEEMKERRGFKNSLELQDGFDSKRKIFSNTYNSIVEFFILHFFISFGGGGRKRESGGFKNSLEFQDGFDSKRKILLNTIQSSNFLFPILHFIQNILLFRRKKNK